MVDLKEEQQYEELRRLAQKLHIPIPEVFLELEVRDKDGRVIQRHRQRSHSWVRNAYNLMIMQGAGINGNESAVLGSLQGWRILARRTMTQRTQASSILLLPVMTLTVFLSVVAQPLRALRIISLTPKLWTAQAREN